ncbi:hypothetical protein [Fluviicola sp.]|uniref:hypothetical protein n=1 Tax=Fluviicola sp. TaxID=1917219 RepID=UPI003D2BD040
MSVQKALYLIIPILGLFSCYKSPSSNHYFVPDFMKQDTIQLSNTLFFIGPEMDTAKMEISAPCDCCASYLAFVNDSVFVYESLCLEGDDYFKGTYFKYRSLIFLKFDPLIVSSTHYPGEKDESTWEKEKRAVFYSKLRFSTLNSEWVISAGDKENMDYGMCNQMGSARSYLFKLKSEGIWDRMKLSNELK